MKEAAEAARLTVGGLLAVDLNPLLGRVQFVTNVERQIAGLGEHCALLVAPVARVLLRCGHVAFFRLVGCHDDLPIVGPAWMGWRIRGLRHMGERHCSCRRPGKEIS